MPLLRTATIQLGILILFNCVTILLVFPACISYDIKIHFKQNHNFKDDISSEKYKKIYRPYHKGSSHAIIPLRQAVTHALPPDGRNVVTVLAPPVGQREDSWPSTGMPRFYTKKDIESDVISITEECRNGFLLKRFLSGMLAPFMLKTPVKVIVIISCVAAMLIGVWGIYHLDDGLVLTDFVPKDTNEYKFLSQRTKYFGLYQMYAVTKGNFKYPTNQRLLYDYHAAFNRIKKVKNENSEPSEFWLSMFRDWLLGLQRAFDEHWSTGCITQEDWCKNATDDAIMAYKLLVQTGRVDNPVDKSLVKTARLVDANGIINTKPFYNYLSAWVSNDALAYSASRAYFHQNHANGSMILKMLT
ncbi:protein patched [Caerostris extrusa]|uniref:Protein patched n=1 Tax=Caerostris extrusa TaxID=172846 RepID=A0AAV4RMC7_CAEEX|nr:protein patched [Caerostris extrusa]